MYFVSLCGCVSAYPKCFTSETAYFRCTGTVIEVCDGQHWIPRTDCSYLYLPDGGQVGHVCLETSFNMAGCVTK
jgi:hypothetical protein